MTVDSFHFKKFSCLHSQSSMKIGVDAVILGCWTNVNGRKILDVGTGCGVIALICAQRNNSAMIEAIDIDTASIDEASANFNNSPWSKRLKATLEDFTDYHQNSIDLIISNPPYFDSGIKQPSTNRERARHKSRLSPEIIITHGSRLLSPNGRISLIVPYEQHENLSILASSCHLSLERICHIKGHKDNRFKRSLLEFTSSEPKKTREREIEELILYKDHHNEPTVEYKELCKDFYLKF